MAHTAHKTLIVERNVEMTTRDGTILRADIYRPDTPLPLPVLLERTPYGKGQAEADVTFALSAAEHGYGVVMQDTRGRWASNGDHAPFVHEKLDGYDAVEWAAHLPWADGQVGMFGSAHAGYNQYAAAVQRPPSLKTILPEQTACDWYEAICPNGVLAAGTEISWALSLHGLPAALRLPDDDPRKGTQIIACFRAIDGLADGSTFHHLPLKDIPIIGRDGIGPMLREWLAHATYDDHWRAIRCPHEVLTLPIFHIGGWYDAFIGSTLRDYTRIRDVGNARQKLLIGPWAHDHYASWVGERDFGIRAWSEMLPLDGLRLRWFDHWLRDIDDGLMSEPPIKLFVMGDDRWRVEHEWSPNRARLTPYYLHSSGKANTLNGDGALSREAPSDEAVDCFVYDPRNPVPTRGGGLCCWTGALPAGVYDQRAVEARPDVLVYSTPPLERDSEVTGSLSVHLWAVTTAPDTDFTVKLVDVCPCGSIHNIQDGIVRARFRRTTEREEPIHPGEVYEYVIDLAGTSVVFKAGHQIRLEVSSSNFPRFDRNLNTGHPVGEDAEMHPALQTILHDAAHPSHILLPIIPR